MLCEAAQHLSQNEGPLGVFVRRIRDKHGWNKSVVAGARKLATIAYFMLKNREPYRRVQNCEYPMGNHAKVD